MPAFLLPLLLNLAPTVASWVLGDKTGKAVETVTGIIQRTTGTDGDPSMANLTAEQTLQLRMALIQAEADNRRLEMEEMKEQLKDVQSARSMTIEAAKAGSPIAWGAAVISALVLIAYGAALYLSVTIEVPASQKDNVAGLLWTLNALAVSVVGFWVGSSAGSFRKDALMAKGQP
jgi:hypothetical protein